jgi:hypothetical protein
MKSVNQSVSAWLTTWPAMPADGLALLRIFTALFLFFFLLPGSGADHIAMLSTMPADLFSPPPGPMRLFTGFPPFEVFTGLYVMLMVSLTALLFGYRTRFASLAAGLLILILQGWIYSIGKTNHEIMIAVVPLVMAFSNWGSVWSMDATSGRGQEGRHSIIPFPYLALILGFMMFTAGFPKILGGWLNPDTQAVYGHLLNQYFVNERTEFLSGYLIRFNTPVIWELLDWATILFEIGFLVAVYRRSWFRVFVCFAVLFHTGIILTLNIAFAPNFVAYAVFMKWDVIASSIRKGSELLRVPEPVLFGTGLICIFIPVKWISITDKVLAGSDLQEHELFILGFAFIIVCIETVGLIRKKRIGTAQNA